MKIVSWNVNGLRSIYGSVFLEWLRVENPDIVCLQEIKIQEHQLQYDMLSPHGYEGVFSFAKKKGYGGVAVYSKEKSIRTEHSLRYQKFDEEGRIVSVEFPRLRVINVYMPLGRPPNRNMSYKMKSYESLNRFVNGCERVVLVGDFNIAHTKKDLAKPESNKGNVKYTQPERRKISELLRAGYIDSFRKIHPGMKKYSYWRYGGDRKECGWRIDYCFVSDDLSDLVESAFIREDIKGSDHKPVGVVLGME